MVLRCGERIEGKEEKIKIVTGKNWIHDYHLYSVQLFESILDCLVIWRRVFNYKFEYFANSRIVARTHTHTSQSECMSSSWCIHGIVNCEQWAGRWRKRTEVTYEFRLEMLTNVNNTSSRAASYFIDFIFGSTLNIEYWTKHSLTTHFRFNYFSSVRFPIQYTNIFTFTQTAFVNGSKLWSISLRYVPCSGVIIAFLSLALNNQIVFYLVIVRFFFFFEIFRSKEQY